MINNNPSIITEKDYLNQSIEKILNYNSETFKCKTYVFNMHKENEYLAFYYNYLVYILNNEFSDEVNKFNEKRQLYLQTYTGDIEYENENFQPYEYLPFIESKSYKKFLQDNFKQEDCIKLIESKDYKKFLEENKVSIMKLYD
jgi:poly-gamma-glutamate capsule biosynthesis protein CapA/YwtB (metallophosphatase superfamily)